MFVKFIKRTNALSLTIWSSLFASLQLFGFSLFFESPELTHLSMPSQNILVALIFSAAFNLFAAYLWNYLIQIYKVNQVVPFGMLLPVFSLIFSYYLLGETTHIVALLGGGLTLGSVCLQSYGK